MTPDLYRLREKQAELSSIFERLELELVDDPSWAEPSDTSYLNATDRANPDIMSNVAAMTATNQLVSWFGRDMEGFVGLWRGAEERALPQAPVVRLDTEGQYSIVAASIPDYLAISMPEDEFARTRETLARSGFQVSTNPDAIWGSLDGFDDPNAYRNELYEQERVQRGLPRSDAEPDEDEEGGDEDLADATVRETPASIAAKLAEPAKPAAKAAPPPAKQVVKPPAAKPAAKANAKPAAKASAKPAAKKSAKPAAKKPAKPAKKPGKRK